MAEDSPKGGRAQSAAGGGGGVGRPEEQLSIAERANGKILVVDDTRAIRSVVRNALVGLNWSVTTAETGAEALGLVSKDSYECVVCDLNMPVIDGFQVMRQVRHIDPTLPVIVLTGEGDLNKVIRAVHEGAFDFVNKEGGDLRPLLAAVDRAVAHCRILRENLRLNVELQAKVEQLEEEKKRSDWLLFNLLPRPVAERLKSQRGEVALAPEMVPECTVLFADIVGFSGLARKTASTPGILIGLLDDLFCTFDSLADSYGVEKIKTIGDAYMAAAGIPVAQKDHAQRAANLALDMMHAVGPYGGGQLNLRVGLHSGPVVSGLIGQKRAIFDLWGDTVNIASRMESQGQEGRIQCTEATKKLLETEFKLEERGTVEVKGYTPMPTWFVAAKTARRR